MRLVEYPILKSGSLVKKKENIKFDKTYFFFYKIYTI